MLVRNMNLALNLALTKSRQGRTFRWTLLQINIGGAYRPHIDKNNVGLSAICLLGNFTGGVFRCPADSIELDSTSVGRWTMIDGSHTHSADPAVGTRVSIVAFYHSSALSLSDDDKQQLVDCGFMIDLPDEYSDLTVLSYFGESDSPPVEREEAEPSRPALATPSTSPLMGGEGARYVMRRIYEVCC